MIEAAFPLLGAAFVVAVVLPLFALLGKGALLVLEHDALGGPLHRLGARYLVLTGSSVLPIAWLLSAAAHQLDSGESLLACLFDHAAAELCLEAGAFALVLFGLLLSLSASTLRGNRTPRPADADLDAPLLRRLDRLVAAHPPLALLQGRLTLTDEPGFALGTKGWLRPEVIVGAAFARALPDEGLASALGHEAEHVRSLDPLRFLALRLALAINPVGRLLLAPHAARGRAPDPRRGPAGTWRLAPARRSATRSPRRRARRAR